MSNFDNFSYFQTFLSLGVKQGLQKLPKFDIYDLKLLFHCNILIPKKCPRKTLFKTQCPCLLLLPLPLQILVGIEAKPSPYKGLGLLLVPPDCKTFLRPYSPYSLTQLDTQWTISLVLIAFAFTYVNAFIARKSSVGIPFWY